jgi:hypothetical protein
MADTSVFPTSYTDPIYAVADQTASATVGIPNGWLQNIRTKGEKSNADQVSSAGAQTPYQITPTTRQAILDQTGVDPYLNPNNAAYGAAYLLKQAADRNGGNTVLATAEYMGGTDQSAWGPKTMAYVKRVTGSSPNNPNATPSFMQTGPDTSGSSQPSNPYQLAAAPDTSSLGSGMPNTPDPNAPSLAKVVSAYQSGQMAPQDAAAFEADVNAGKVLLPRGVSLNAPDTGNQAPGTMLQLGANNQVLSQTPPPSPMAQAPAAPQQQAAPGMPAAQQPAIPGAPAAPTAPPMQVPSGAVTAFNSGTMAPNVRAQLQADIASGRAALPQGTTLTDPNAPPQSKGFVGDLGHQLGLFGRDALQAAGNTVGLAYDPIAATINTVGGLVGHNPAIAPLGAQAVTLANNLGLPKPVGSLERGVNAAAQGVAEAGAFSGAGAAASDLPGVVGQIGKTFSADAGKQAAAMAAGQAASQHAQDAGYSPAAQTAINIGTMVLALGGASAAESLAGKASPAVSDLAQRIYSGTSKSAAPAAERVEPTMGGAPAAQPVPAAAPPEAPAATEVTPAAPTAAPAAPPVSAPAAPATSAEASAPLKPGSAAVWRNADNDIPVTFKHIEPQPGADGKTYARVVYNGNDAFVPADELASGSAPRAAPAAAPTAAEAAPIAAPSSTPIEAQGAVNPVAANAAEFMPASELATQARKAVGAQGAPFGLGKNTAQEVLATQGAADPETLAAAQRLGIEDNLQPDHLTSNQAYRELAQAIKSTPGSIARSDEMQGLSQVAQRGQQIVQDAGGTSDLSSLSSNVKNDLMNTQQQLSDHADGLYKQIRQAIPATAPAPATNVLAQIQAHAEELGGVQFLSGPEKKILFRLSPKTSTVMQPVEQSGLGTGLSGAGGSAAGTKMEPVQVTTHPTYGLLDQTRKDIGDGYKHVGPFKDQSTTMLDRLYGALSKDQEAVVMQHGAGELWQTAKAAVQMRKGIENDMTSLYGKDLGDSLVGKLGTAMAALPKGDETKFVNLMKSIPPSMRQQVTASGLQYAFGKATKNGELNFKTYADWMDGLKKNSGAFNAVMSNLPADARSQLLDLATVSRGVSNATRETITTGRIMAAREDLNAAPDGLISRIMDKGKQAAVGAVVGGAAHVAGPVGAGLGHAVISALTHSKPDVMVAADKLITSPEFVQLTKTASNPAPATVTAAANSPAMRRFYALAKDVTASNDPGARERWLTGIVNSVHQSPNTNRQ